jgi:hypothetical protein
VRGANPPKASDTTSPWTIPIRDLFLFSTGIAVLLAISIPIIKSIEMPTGFPPGSKQMIVAAVAMYIGLAWLTYSEFRQRFRLAVLLVIMLVMAIVAGATYEFVTGNRLIFKVSSFEMALFRVSATALITYFICLRLMFDDRPS